MSEQKQMQDAMAVLQKRKARTDEEILAEHLEAQPVEAANAVAASVRGYPRLELVETLPHGYGLMPPETMYISRVAGFPVACYSAWNREDGSTNSLLNLYGLVTRSFIGTCLLFGWENDAPAPFTTEQAKIVCEILTKAKIQLDRRK